MPRRRRKISQLAVEPIEGEPTPEYVHAVWARLHGFVLKATSDRSGSASRR